jgi:CRP-like cAMP-binding protein
MESIIFSDFSKDEIKNFISFFEKIHFSDKDIIFHEGSSGREFCIIEKGYVSITKKVNDDTDTIIIKLGPGDFFGELTMFEDFHRTATARTEGEAILLFINHKNLLNMLEANPGIAAKFFMSLLKVMALRLRRTSTSLKEAIIWGCEVMDSDSELF